MSNVFSLQTNLVNKYWEEKNYQLSNILKEMDSLEYWTNDEDVDVKKALVVLTDILRSNTVPAEKILEEIDSLLIVMAYLKSSTALRLLEWFDVNYKQLAEQIMVITSKKIGDVHPRLLYERVSFIKKVNLLKNIFSEDRVDRVKKILNKLSDQERL